MKVQHLSLLISFDYAIKQQWYQPKEGDNCQSAEIIKTSCSETTAELLLSRLSATSAITRSTGNKFIIQLASVTYFILLNPEMHCTRSRWDLQKLINWSYKKVSFCQVFYRYLMDENLVTSFNSWAMLALSSETRTDLLSPPQQW